MPGLVANTLGSSRRTRLAAFSAIVPGDPLCVSRGTIRVPVLRRLPLQVSRRTLGLLGLPVACCTHLEGPCGCPGWRHTLCACCGGPCGCPWCTQRRRDPSGMSLWPPGSSRGTLRMPVLFVRCSQSLLSMCLSPSEVLQGACVPSPCVSRPVSAMLCVPGPVSVSPVLCPVCCGSRGRGIVTLD